MKTRASWLLALLMAASVGSATFGCELGGPSKVAHGQRYQSDDSRFDPYFDSVHQQQVAAAAWPDEKKTARSRLTSTLGLTPNASDDMFVSAARGRTKPHDGADAALVAAVEESGRLELERARRLRATGEKLETMAQHGEELKKSADRDFANRGAAKADEKITEKHDEVRRELGGAVRALHELARSASREAKEAHEFADDVRAAIKTKDNPQRRGREAAPAPQPSPPPPSAQVPSVEVGKAETPRAADSAPPAHLQPPKRPVGKPKPKPDAPPNEVFNP